MHFEINGERFLSPPQHAIWVPPFAMHFSYALGDTVYRSAYVSLERSRGMPARSCTVSVSPVLRAILDDFAFRDIRAPAGKADFCVAQVALDQIRNAGQGAACLPSGASAKLNRLQQQLRRAPRDQRTIAELEGGAQVEQLACQLGYATTSAFIVMFKRMTGATPEQCRLSRSRLSPADAAGL